MLKRELKVNLKSFIIWLSILLVMFLFVYLIYPYIITDETMKSMDELMKIFPQDVLKAFNMDITSISSAYGWMKTEGFMFVLLLTGFYSSILGANILLKEESEHTIEYLGSLPVKRSNIITSKIIASLIFIVSMILIFGIFNYVALSITGDFEHKQFILLSITPLLIALPLFAINLYISTHLHKTKKTLAISLGMVFIFYIINVLSELSTKVEVLKYFSIYTLADIRNVITKVRINPIMVLISLGITTIFIIASYIRYNKKELL